MNLEQYTVCIKKDESTNLFTATINNIETMSLILSVPGTFKTEKDVYNGVLAFLQTLNSENNPG